MPEKLLGSMCTRCGHVELWIGIDKGERIAYCPEGGDAKSNKHTRRVLGKIEKVLDKVEKIETSTKKQEIEEVDDGISTR